MEGKDIITIRVMTVSKKIAEQIPARWGMTASEAAEVKWLCRTSYGLLGTLDGTNYFWFRGWEAMPRAFVEQKDRSVMWMLDNTIIPYAYIA